MKTQQLNHFTAEGHAQMVDIAEKMPSRRIAIATGKIIMQKTTRDIISAGTAKKGDVLGVARIAAIMAAKRTSELIPLCHPLPLTSIVVQFENDPDSEGGLTSIACTVQVETIDRTGVEIEALMGTQIALLTIFDMCKAVDRQMVISDVRVLEKHGGKSGSHDFR